MSDKMCDALVAIVAIIVLAVCLCHKAKADDYSGPRAFHVAFGLSPETLAQEAAWQILNVVDAHQSLMIPKHPDRFQEAGTPSIFGYNHPTKNQVIAFSVAFGVLHYAVSKGIESLIDHQEPDENGFRSYRVLQRVWQYSELMYKIYTVENNHQVGAGW